jgi:midasin (ATPase involved in ribosome maturation)
MVAMVARFRSHADRAHVCARYKEVFGVVVPDTGSPRVCVLPDMVTVGCAVLPRVVTGRGAAVPTGISAGGAAGFTPALHGHLKQLERVAVCVEMAWPCLLVGPSATGKSRHRTLNFGVHVCTHMCMCLCVHVRVLVCLCCFARSSCTLGHLDT